MYATKQNMIERYAEQQLIELTDRVPPYDEAIVDTVLNLALSDADAVINSYIAGRYQLPIASTPDVLRRHACIIAYYDLHRGRHPEEVRKDYEDSIAFLKSVARGDAKLDVAGIEPPSSPAEARVDGPERVFNRNSLKAY